MLGPTADNPPIIVVFKNGSGAWAITLLFVQQVPCFAVDTLLQRHEAKM